MKPNIENMLKMFAKIRKYYAKKLHERFKEVELSPNEINILIVLSNNPNITTSSELIAVLDVSKGLVSRSIDHLVKMNILCLKQDKKDRRVIRLCLTREGQELMVTLNQAIKEINEEMFSHIPSEELKELEVTTKKIIAYFEMED